MKEKKQSYNFFYNFRIRYSEVDAQGIVFNAHYLTYFDCAITEYFRIENNSDSTISFIAIKSDIADIQEIHEVILEDNIYKMRPIKSGLEIKPKSSLDFKPKSYHIMFYKIKKSFLPEEMVKAKLLFNSNIIIDVEFKVIVGNSHHSH